MALCARSTGLLSSPRSKKFSGGRLKGESGLKVRTCPSGSVRLRWCSAVMSTHGPAVRIPAQMRDMSQMPQPVKVTPFDSASVSISAASSGSLVWGK